jgi:hypothetical protein
MNPAQASEQVFSLEGNGPTWIVLGLFVLLSLVAGSVASFIGKIFFRSHPLRYTGFLLFAMLGGLIGIFMHIYATQYLALSKDRNISSLLNMFSVFSVFTFLNMLAVPLFVLLLRSKNRKIKELQEELNKKPG